MTARPESLADSPRQNSSYDEVDVRQYLMLLWRHRVKVAIVTLAGGGIAALVSWFTPPVYLATARLYVRSGPAGPAAAELAAKYRPLFDGPELARQVVQELGLDKPPVVLTTAQLHTAMAVRVADPGDALLVDVRLGAATAAARVATSVARHAIDAARELDKAAPTSPDSLRTRMDRAESALGRAQAAVRTFRRSSQIEAMRADAAAIVKQREDLLNLDGEIEAENARVRTAQAQLAQTPRTIALAKSTTGTPDMSSEVINPVYDELSRESAASQIRLGGFEAQRNLESDPSRLDILNALAERDNQLTQLDAVVARSQSAYDQLAENYQQAVGLSATPRPGLELAEEAPVPDRRIAPRASMDIVTGLAVGLFLSALAVVFLHSVFFS